MCERKRERETQRGGGDPGERERTTLVCVCVCVKNVFEREKDSFMRVCVYVWMREKNACVCMRELFVCV